MKKPKQNIFFQIYGGIVFNNATLENLIAITTAGIIRPDNYEIGLIAISKYSITKCIDILNACIHHMVEDKLFLEEFEKVIKDCSIAIGRRNTLVHSYFTQEQEIANEPDKRVKISSKPKVGLNISSEDYDISKLDELSNFMFQTLKKFKIEMVKMHSRGLIPDAILIGDTK